MQKIKNRIIRDNIGLVIRYNRKKKCVSQKVLAKKVGISRTHLIFIENQTRIPSFALFSKIANQLGKTTTDLGLEALLENYDGRFGLLVLRAEHVVSKVIESGDKEKQRKLLEFMKLLDRS